MLGTLHRLYSVKQSQKLKEAGAFFPTLQRGLCVPILHWFALRPIACPSFPLVSSTGTLPPADYISQAPIIPSS